METPIMLTPIERKDAVDAFLKWVCDFDWEAAATMKTADELLESDAAVAHQSDKVTDIMFGAMNGLTTDQWEPFMVTKTCISLLKIRHRTVVGVLADFKDHFARVKEAAGILSMTWPSQPLQIMTAVVYPLQCYADWIYWNRACIVSKAVEVARAQMEKEKEDQEEEPEPEPAAADVATEVCPVCYVTDLLSPKEEKGKEPATSQGE